MIPSQSGSSTLALNTTQADRQALLTGHREGGGTSCSDIAVYESGYVEITSCQAAAPLARRLLSEDTTAQLQLWAETYQSFEVEQTKGTGESRVTTRLRFAGRGSHPVSELEVRMIQAILETLVSSQ